MTSRKRFLTLVLAVTLSMALACGGGGESAYEYDDEEVSTAAGQTGGTQTQAAAAPADAATITGLVKLEGTPPAMPNIPMGADPSCTAAHPTPVQAEDVVVAADGSLANVFVYVKDYSGPTPSPAGPALLDQVGCMYTPRVSGVQVGQTLNIKNSDPTLHNVHALAKENREFNIGQPVQGMVSERKFDKPEVMIRVKCDVHGWMTSYLGVLSHPFFGTSSEGGAFTIANLPPGTYTLEAWHEKFGTQTQQVTVGPSESKPVNFTFKAS